jgi:hypothetical protein
VCVVGFEFTMREWFEILREFAASPLVGVL